MTLPVNEIICGDCLKVMKDWPGGSVDAVIADWPYSTGAGREADKGYRKSMTPEIKDRDWFDGDSLTTNSFIWFARSVAWEACRVSMDGSHSLWFIDWRMFPMAMAAIETAGWKVNTMVVWDKERFALGWCFRSQHELIIHSSRGTGKKPDRLDVGNVLHYQRVAIAQRHHPTEKPLDLMLKLISTITREGEIVVDPTCGSGTTCVAAKMLGRKYIGIDISEEYCEIARERLAAVETGVPISERLAGQKGLFDDGPEN